jgi:hypothetical protein
MGRMTASGLAGLMAVLGGAVAGCTVAGVTGTGSGFAFIEGSAISCAAAENCLAVDTIDATGIAAPVADAWNGRTLKTIPAPPASGGENVIDGLSCVAAKDCVAMTSSMDSDGSGIDTWNGSEWKARPAADLDGVAAGISTLSCVSTTSCAAVGTFLTDSSATTGFGFTEVLSGSTWKENTISWPQEPACPCCSASPARPPRTASPPGRPARRR